MTNLYLWAINQWRWSITWGWYQLVLGLVCSTAIFMGMRRQKSLPALILIITSYWSAFIVYLMCLLLVSIYMTKVLNAQIEIISGITFAAVLAFFFTILQGFFIKIVHNAYKVRLQCILMVTFVANGIAAVITYLLTNFVDKEATTLLPRLYNFLMHCF